MPNRQYNEIHYNADNYGGIKRALNAEYADARFNRAPTLFIGFQKLGVRFQGFITSNCRCRESEKTIPEQIVSAKRSSHRKASKENNSARSPRPNSARSPRPKAAIQRTGGRRRASAEPYVPPPKWEKKSTALLSKCAKYTVKGAKARTRGNVALFNACSLGQEKLAKKALSPPNVPDVNDVNQLGFTPLMVACQNALQGDTEEVRHGSIVCLLLDANADIGMEDHEQRTTLHHALLGGGLAIVQLLVDRNADLRQRDKGGRSAVMLAALSDCISLTSWVLVKLTAALKVKEDVLISWTDHADWTAVHHACQAGSENVLRFLVARGAQFLDFKGSRADGARQLAKTSEMLQGGTPPILLAAIESHLEICAYLMRVRQDQLPEDGTEAGLLVHADIRRWRQEMNNDPLIIQAANLEGIIVDLAEKGDKKSLEKLQQKIQELENSASRRGDIDVEHYVSGEHFEVQKGITPLLAAAASPNTGTSVVKTLIQARAALPGPRDDQGRSALLRCARNEANASFRVLKVLVRELVQRQEKEKVQDMGLTAVDVDCCGLLLCSVTCQVEKVALDKTKFVLSQFCGETSSKTLWTKRDHQGCLALHIAARNGHLELMTYIGERMLPKDWPPNEKGKAKILWDCGTWGGATAVLLAAENLHLHVCQELFERNADIFMKDASGLGFPDYVNRSNGSQTDQTKLVDWFRTKQALGSGYGSGSSRKSVGPGQMKKSKTFMQRVGIARGGSGALISNVRQGVAAKLGSVVRSLQMLRNASNPKNATNDVPAAAEEEESEDEEIPPPLLKMSSSMVLDERPEKRKQTCLLWTCTGCKKQNMPSHDACTFCKKAKGKDEKKDNNVSAGDTLEVRAKNGDCVVYKLEAHPTQAGQKALFSYENGELEGQVSKIKVHHAKFCIEDIVAIPGGGQSPGELHLDAWQKTVLENLVVLAKQASDIKLIELGISKRVISSPNKTPSSPKRSSNASPRQSRETPSSPKRSSNASKKSSNASPRQNRESAPPQQRNS